MRNLFILILATCFIVKDASAITFIKLRPGVEGISKVEYRLDKKISLLEKNSNFFDTKINYEIGKFSIPSSRTEGPIKSLNSLVLKVADLKSESIIKPHESYFVLEGKKVGEDSPLYKTLGKVFNELQNLPWKLEEGISLSLDLKSRTLLKEGKVIIKENFNKKFFCSNSERPNYCLDKNYGIIYVE